MPSTSFDLTYIFSYLRSCNLFELVTEGIFFFFIPANNLDFRTVPTIGGACKRSDLLLDPRTYYAEPLLNVVNTGPQIDHTRSYTSVSLTLRPPSSEPQPPIDIRSQGSSLTYSSSSLDPRGFQSRLQISIGAGAVGTVAAARIRPPMGPNRPNSLIPPAQTGPQRPPGLYYFPLFAISSFFFFFNPINKNIYASKEIETAFDRLKTCKLQVFQQGHLVSCRGLRRQ